MSVPGMTQQHRYGKGERSLGIALGLTLSFFIVELIGGFLTNSLALITDAWHMLNDVFSLAFAFLAARVATRPITNRKTYGYRRVEILVALLNGMLLWAIVIFIFYEAIQRLQNPSEVESLEMLLIAAGGLVANGLSALALSRSKDTSLNVKGAFLHVVADTMGSLGAIFAGLIMFFTDQYQADSLFSMAIGLLILYSSGKLIRESVNVLLEGVPSHIDLSAIERRMLEVKGVKNVHDLHVWCITPTEMCIMSCHVVLEGDIDRKALMGFLIQMLIEEFGIDHTTIQLEDEGYPKAAEEH